MANARASSGGHPKKFLIRLGDHVQDRGVGKSLLGSLHGVHVGFVAEAGMLMIER
jgi:hypothetical protein